MLAPPLRVAAISPARSLGVSDRFMPSATPDATTAGLDIFLTEFFLLPRRWWRAYSSRKMSKPEASPCAGWLR